VIGPSSPNFWGPADINGDGVVSCRDYVPFSVGYWHLLADPCGLTSDLNNDSLVDDSDFFILAEGLSSVEARRNASNGPYETARWSWSAGSGAVQLFDFTMNIPTTAGPSERYPIVATPLEVLIGTMVSGNPCDQIQLVPPTTVAAQLELRTPGQACTGDLNGDQQVDDSDFVIFAVAYNVLDCADGAMPPGCPADFNDDQFVDDSDFVLFASAYDALLCP
jgi:hypothetical protein